MKNIFATILSVLLFLPVNLYLMIFARDVFPCEFEVVRDTTIEALGGY